MILLMEAPTLYLIGGCNGAGKTTFARRLLPIEGVDLFLNADEIARGLSPLKPELAAIRAGRLLLEEAHRLIAAKKSFGLESTLSGKTYAHLMQEAKAAGRHESVQVIRPRTLLYLGMFSIVGLIMLVAWFHRTVLEINVLHDRSPPFVLMSDGGIRNGYTVKILNKLHEPRTIELSARGLSGARLSIVGLENAHPPRVRVPTDDLQELRVYVAVPAAEVARLQAASVPFSLIVHDTTSSTEMARTTSFQMPQPTQARTP